MRAQALDAGLEDADAGPRERMQLLPLQVCLDLVEDRVVDAVLDQRAAERLEVAHVQDVVHGLEVGDLVAGGLAAQLPVHPLG